MLNLDPDPEILPSLDPDPGSCYHFRKNVKIVLEEIFIFKIRFLKNLKRMALEEFFLVSRVS